VNGLSYEENAEMNPEPMEKNSGSPSDCLRSSGVNPYCTVSAIVLLVTMVLLVVFVIVAVMFVVPAGTLVANPLPLLRPLLIVATLVLDEVQVTAFVRSSILCPLA